MAPIVTGGASKKLVAGDYPAIPSIHVIEHGVDVTITGVSLRGRGHEIRGQARQDAIGAACTDEWTVLTVADGVGSEPHSALGAAVAADAAAHWFGVFASECGLSGPRSARMSLSRARAAVRGLAERGAGTVRELASTLLVAGLRESETGASELVVAWTGDGAIVAWQQSDRPLVRVFGQVVRGSPDSVQPIGTSNGRDWHANTLSQELPGHGWRVALMTDGLSDDFGGNFPLLAGGLENSRGDIGSLVQLLRYRKRGSFDDRSVVIVGPKEVGTDALG